MNRFIVFLFLGLMNSQVWALTDITQEDEAFYRKLLAAPDSKVENRHLDIQSGILTKDSKVVAVHEHKFLQHFIDEAFARIMLNQKGLNFCALFATDVETIAEQTSVSLVMAGYLAIECRKRIQQLYGVDYPIMPRNFLKRNKRFYFVLDKNRKYNFDSWTTMDNKTYLFIDSLEPPVNIYRRLIHELYIPFDDKQTLGPGKEKIFATDGLEVKNHYPFNIGVKKGLEQALEFLNYPLIQYAFISMRSVMFEDQILGSMLATEGIDMPDEHYETLKLSCWDYFNEVGKSLLPYQHLLLPVEYGIGTESELKKSAQDLILDKKKLSQISKEIQSKKLYFFDKNENININFCLYMYTPLLSDLGTLFAKGPRPRIGSGWGGSQGFLLEDQLGLMDKVGFPSVTLSEAKDVDSSSFDTVDLIYEIMQRGIVEQQDSGMKVIPVETQK